VITEGWDDWVETREAAHLNASTREMLSKLDANKLKLEKKKLKKAAHRFIGLVIRKKFDGYGVFEGTVVGVGMFDTGLAYHVKYTDGDEEDMDEEELMALAARG
jgi:hypothetical protein